ADFVLLLGREHVNDTVYGFGGTGSMKGSEDQVTGAGSDQGQFDGFKVAQLTDQDDVRIFAQSSAQSRSKGFGMYARFPMIYQAVLAFVHELDGVLNCNDMVPSVFITVVHHGGQGGGFA